MDLVYLLFWVTMALLGGFLIAYIARWEAGMGLAAVAAIVAIGLGLAVPLGGSWQLAILATVLTAGLVWGALRSYISSFPECDCRLCEYKEMRGCLSLK